MANRFDERQQEIEATLRDLLGGERCAQIGRRICNVENAIARRRKSTLRRLISGIGIERLVAALPRGPVHLVSPSWVPIAPLISRAAHTKRVVVEENPAFLRLAQALGANQVARAATPLKEVLRQSKQASDEDVLFVTFPDIRCLNFRSAIKVPFLSKSRYFGFEDSLSLKCDGLSFGALTWNGDAVSVDWLPRNGGSFEAQAHQAIQLCATNIEQVYGRAPTLVLGWLSARSLCSDAVEARKSMGLRVAEGLIMQAMRLGVDRDIAQRALAICQAGEN